jgi:predicted amidohydrolase
MTTSPRTLRIGLASVRNDPSFDTRLATVDRVLGEAAQAGVAVVCFPEAYLPGLRGNDFEVMPHDQARQSAALETVRDLARRHGVMTLMGMEWESPRGLHIVTVVIDRDGSMLGHQAKTQVARTEEPFYAPGDTRRMFAIDGVSFGISICHELWRYPETVRWAARRGARIVFQPQLTGSDLAGRVPSRWLDPDAPYYEKAMLARVMENDIFLASASYAMRYPEAATVVLGPDGDVVAMQPYGEPGLLVADIDLTRETGTHARRYAPERYPAE